LERHNDSVADADGGHLVTDRDHFGQPFVPDGITGRQGRRTAGGGDIEIAAGYDERPDQRMPRCRNDRVRTLAPRVPATLYARQLSHHCILERSLK
jgi:hypothetical protein